MTDRILRPREAALKLGISKKTLDRWSNAGTLPAKIKLSTKAVGWRESDLNTFIDQRAQVH